MNRDNSSTVLEHLVKFSFNLFVVDNADLKNRQVYLPLIYTTQDLFFLCTRFDNFGWNPFLILSKANWPEKCYIRVILCNEKIRYEEAVKSKRKNLVWSKVYPSYTPSRHCTIFQEKGSDWAGGLLSDCEKKALLNENFVSENFSLSLINLRKTSWFLWFVFTKEQQLGLQSSWGGWQDREKMSKCLQVWTSHYLLQS